MTNPTKISPKGRRLIKDFEGLSLTAYQDIAGVWTIGYGSTGPHVTPGLTITEAEADDLLTKDLGRFERCVSQRVTVRITQNQYDALVSLAFNIGCDAFRLSTALRKLNANDDFGAADAILLWNKVTINGKRVESAGLTRRRKAERALFLEM